MVITGDRAILATTMRGLMVVAGAAGAAVGDAQAQQGLDATLSVEVAVPGGAFTEFVAATPGQVIDVRVLARFTSGAALASAVYNIRGQAFGFSNPVSVTNPRRIAPFNFGGQTIAVFASANTFRIDDTRDAADSVAMGILSNQRAPAIGSPANVSNPAEVFRFSMTMPNQQGLVHVRIPWEQVRNSGVSVYLSPIDSPTRFLSNVGTDGAWVYVGGNPCLGQQITTPPSRRVLAGTDVVLATSGDGPTWQWFKNSIELFESERVRGAESATLTLQNIRPEDSGSYVVFTMCSHSDAVRVDAFCRADFNNDGFIDFFDYEAYVECFETGTCPGTLPERVADFNADGFADFFDYDAFVQAFETGAC